MLDIAFGEGAAGALKAAFPHADVLPLTLALDIGPLADMDGSRAFRGDVLQSLYGEFPGVVEALAQGNLRGLARLRAAGEVGEPVRLWVAPADPAELCGLYFICHFLRDGTAGLSAVFVPPVIVQADAVVEYHSTGEVPPEDLLGLAERERPLANAERTAYRMAWRDLAAENAQLRAVVNGRVLGVPEDFYDFALRARLPQGEFVVARLLGKTLLALPGVGDRWLYLRLRAMVAAGEVEAVSPPRNGHPYSGVMKTLS